MRSDISACLPAWLTSIRGAPDAAARPARLHAREAVGALLSDSGGEERKREKKPDCCKRLVGVNVLLRSSAPSSSGPL